MSRFFVAGDMAAGDVAVCGIEDGGVVCMVAERPALGEFINCCEGALRGRRSLRDLYTGFAPSLPMVGIKIFHRDQRER
jgi:hypothetical protein